MADHENALVAIELISNLMEVLKGVLSSSDNLLRNVDEDKEKGVAQLVKGAMAILEGKTGKDITETQKQALADYLFRTARSKTASPAPCLS